jgi:hypothetical protein
MRDGTVHTDIKRIMPYVRMQRMIARCSGASRREEGHSPSSSLPLLEEEIEATTIMLSRFGVDEEAVFANEWREELMKVSGMTPLWEGHFGPRTVDKSTRETVNAQDLQRSFNGREEQRRNSPVTAQRQRQLEKATERQVVQNENNRKKMQGRTLSRSPPKERGSPKKQKSGQGHGNVSLWERD